MMMSTDFTCLGDNNIDVTVVSTVTVATTHMF